MFWLCTLTMSATCRGARGTKGVKAQQDVHEAQDEAAKASSCNQGMTGFMTSWHAGVGFSGLLELEAAVIIAMNPKLLKCSLLSTQ